MSSAAAPDPTDGALALEGRSVDRYVLRYLVASGGMASVYLAQLAGHGGFEKWVALKRIHAHLAEDPRFVSMFLDEARVSSRIQHQNVCSVIDFGQDEGAPYLVMEYLHGETLAHVARRGRDSDGLPTWLAARAVADAARGLHAAHELTDQQGQNLEVVHRDVSPQNIVVLYDGVSKVLDFGVAKARGRLETTSTGEVKGKSSYFAPEQIESGTLDRRVDVWALGVVLWELLCLRRLFRGDSEAATLHRVLHAEIPAPSSMREVPKELDAVVLRALSRNPAERYATTAEMADALESWLYTLGRPAGQAQVADWMLSHFKDKKATREAMLRSEAVPGRVPSVDIDSRRSMPSSGSRVEVKKGKGAPLGVLGMIGGGLVLIALTAGVMWLALGRGDTTSDPTPAATPPLANSGAPAAGTPPVALGTSSAAATTAATSTGPSALAPGSDTAVTPEPAEVPAAAEAAPAEPELAVAPADEPPDRPRRDDVARPRAPGRLNLIAIPAGEVFLGSRSLGSTPLLGVSLPAGRHHLVVRGAGPPRSVDVTIRSGELTRASVR